MRRLILNLIIIFVVLGKNWFVIAEAESAYPIEATTSCGRVVLKQCWCITKNPCESDNKSEAPIDVPNVDEENILTKHNIQNNNWAESPNELNLSGQRFKRIDKNAFDNFINVTSIDLANNDITELPTFIFSKLKNLEHLSLAGNRITSTKNVFAGLTNLKSLNITNNPLTNVLDDNCFFGLTKSCDIFIKGNRDVQSIGTEAFGHEFPTLVQEFTNKSSNNEEPKSIHTRSASLYPRYSYNDRKSSGNFDVQVCMKEHTVHRLDVMEMNNNLTSYCNQVEIKYNTLFLSKLAISEFETGWYRLKGVDKVPSSFSAISLTGNKIVRVTSNVMNELPAYITWLDLDENKIKRLVKGTFEHEYIFSLELSNNLIGEIEDNTFKMPKLYQLFLQENQLKDTKFAATLPSSLTSLYLNRNKITDISANSFSNLKDLRYLNLDMNRITTLQSQSLRGATALGQLILSHNKITTVEPGAFDDLNNLWQLIINHNNISNLDRGTFTRLVNLQYLNIGNNKLTKIKNELFDLPDLKSLTLNDNNISIIKKGAFRNLIRLETLDISTNPIKRLENGVLFGLPKTRKTLVHVTKTPMEVIQGGLFDNV